MSDNLLVAKVSLEIDDKKAVAQANKAAANLQQKLGQAHAKTNAALTQNLQRSTDRVVGQAMRASEQVGRALERGLKVAAGAGGSAIYAFLKSGTPEALKFANSIDKIKVAWAGVGEKLATKVRFNGKPLTEWVDVLADKLANLDVRQIEKLVGYAKAMGYAFGAIKLAQTAKFLLDMRNSVRDMRSGLRDIGSGGRSITPGNNQSMLPLNSGMLAGALSTLRGARPGRGKVLETPAETSRRLSNGVRAALDSERAIRSGGALPKRGALAEMGAIRGSYLLDTYRYHKITK